MPKLILTQFEFAGQSCELPDGNIMIGRDPHNTIIVQHDSVSAHHCELLVYGAEVIVHDLRSRNGTFVDEVQVTGQSGIRHGQILRLGEVAIRVEIGDPLDDDATSVTAMDNFRKVVKGSKKQAASVPKFPVVFAQVKSP